MRRSRLGKYDKQRMLKYLHALRDECKADGLSTECAMVTLVVAVACFADAFDNGPRMRWSAHFGQVRLHLRNLLHALESENCENDENDENSQDHPLGVQKMISNRAELSE